MHDTDVTKPFYQECSFHLRPIIVCVSFPRDGNFELIPAEQKSSQKRGEGWEVPRRCR